MSRVFTSDGLIRFALKFTTMKGRSAMTWDEIRLLHPATWVIIEAVEAYSRDNRRVLEQVAVVDVFGDDGESAMRRYIQLHRAHPEREMYVVNTERLQLDIEERYWTGVRAAP